MSEQGKQIWNSIGYVSAPTKNSEIVFETIPHPHINSDIVSDRFWNYWNNSEVVSDQVLH